MDALTAPAPRKRASRNGEDKVDRSQTDWYRDAVIYQLHIKAFFDSDGNGMGDFTGLIDRLDYIASLGVTAIWLLPFYPSPMRDDGYDIADYRSINPVYGTMRDFRRFVAEAHKRGIRVIIELVINHTSDQHHWFQRARRAKPGSVARDYYVWSDTDKLYSGTRIIFIDTEQSNWTWDPVANAFFWHRFYSHQPDLNFDNPHVMEEVKRLLHYWLDTGVDGLRLDAIPYLVERDGTNNENLPETHAVLKELRHEVDASYPDRMLLAEANQWPEDTRPYFGEGDECHMAFHFPLMPRMYMALAQEDRHPITDIIRQTPDIPDTCQWAIFLRNHDELTLEMVTAEERDYLWRTYASDSRARINLGIRRRLAPLLDNDRRKIELMNALLLSMSGTPVIYYGDELGMGDNYFLGDRDGVRTPMQWTADRNGGFSRANPQQLYLPPIMDPVYGFQAVNVEAQNTEASSLLNWMRRMISVRKQHPAFGRGTLTILLPQNRKVLAYVREHAGERILCVANLSRAAQAVELDLSDYRGAVPVELAGNAAFPPIGTLPYMLTLPAYGFYWFLLAPEADAPSWHTQMPDPLPEFVTLTAAGGNLARVIEDRELTLLQRDVLPPFLGHQNWFRGGAKRVRKISVTSIGVLPGTPNQLLYVDVEPNDDRPRRYFLPVTALWGETNLHLGAPKLSYTLARLRHGPYLGALIDASFDERFHWDLVKAMRAGTTVPGVGGSLVFESNAGFREVELTDSIRPVGIEERDAAFIVGSNVMMKVYRRLRPGEHPEVSIGRFLTEVAGFEHTPGFYGSLQFKPDEGEPVMLAAAFTYIRNQGDAWSAIQEALDRDLEAFALLPRDENGVLVDPAPAFDYPLDLAGILGTRTAELHRAFATPTSDRAFAAEPIRPADLKRWMTASTRRLNEAIAIASRVADETPQALDIHSATLRRVRTALTARIKACAKLTDMGLKTRVHGSFNLVPVLIVKNDVAFIDFEGESHRITAERHRKVSPLRDIASMLRSFDYAALSAIRRMEERDGTTPPERDRALAWRDTAIRGFLDAYWPLAIEAGLVPADETTRNRLLDLFLINRIAEEIAHEALRRPTWLWLPVHGLLSMAVEDEAHP